MLRGGMLFRLRHLNTGRLLVLDELSDGHGGKVKSTSLSAHLKVNTERTEINGRQKVTLVCKD